jgi:ABC-type nitrate/sulfonate/bicarbonate transport system substrate-binding protein
MRVPVRVTAGALVGLLGVVLSACGGSDSGGSAAKSDSANQPVTIRVAHNSNAAALPARVADAQGFFKKHNVDVKFTQVEDVSTLPPALGKSFEIVLSAPTLEISATSHNIPMTVVSGATVDTQENPTVSLVASGASGVKDIKQLAGKTLGSLSPTGTIGVSTAYWLKQSGVDLSSVKVIAVNGPQQADQMKAARVDAVVTVAPFSSQLMALPGSVDLGDPYLHLAPKISGINWAASTDWADKNQTAVKNFRAALGEAISWIRDHDPEARKVLQSYTQLSDQVAQNLKFPTYETEVRQGDLDKWLTAMKEADNFTGKVNTSQMVAKP